MIDHSSSLFSFEKVSPSHLPLLRNWLNASHVRGCYDTGYDSIEEVASKYLTAHFGEKRFIGKVGGHPFGYIQSYPIDDSHLYASYRHRSRRTLGIDLFVGDPAFLRKGYAFEMLCQFVAQLDRDVERIVVDPSSLHTKAIDLFSKYGFKQVGQEGSHLILVLDLRRAVRGVIFNPQQEIALIQFRPDPDKEEQRHLPFYWLTPGGKIEMTDATEEIALEREIWEETGLTDVHIDRFLFADEKMATWMDTPVRLFNRYYKVHTKQLDFDRSGLMEDEQRFVLGYKWWSLEELITTQEVIYPTQFASRLHRSLSLSDRWLS